MLKHIGIGVGAFIALVIIDYIKMSNPNLGANIIRALLLWAIYSIYRVFKDKKEK